MREAAHDALCVHCDLPVPSGRRGATTTAFCCFGCRIAWELARPAASGDGPAVAGTLLLRLGLGIFLAMNIMAFGWLSYAQELFGDGAGPYGALEALFAYLLLFLCTIVVVLLGLPLAADALANAAARRGRIDANLLICIGVASAYLLSLLHTVRGAGSLYFDTAAMVLVLVTLGNYLEAQAKRRAALSGDSLLASASATAWVERGEGALEIDACEVKVGDRVRVRPGEALPVDGPVVRGASHVDESTLTGESVARAVRVGDELLAGTLNLDGLLSVRARQVGPARVVARVRQLLHEARLRQPPLQRIADRIAALFVPVVITVALALFGWHAWGGDLPRGLFVALSVLLISCPCALGLAAPLATWNALRRAAAAGVLVDSGVTLERAAHVTRLYFDKTGTLTRPEPTVARILTTTALTAEQALGLAATLESASLHPIARALVAEARARGLAAGYPQDPHVLPGLGIEAAVDGRELALGNVRLLEQRGIDPGEVRADPADGPTAAVYLCDRTGTLARFDLQEALRDDARTTLEALRAMNVDVSVLTGDREDPAARLAVELDLPFESGLLPEDKLQRLERERGRAGKRVAMVGDGINDAPVLAAADVGIAVGSAADLAKRAGNVCLLTDRLDRVPLLLRIARHTRRRIRINLLWAFAYNVVGIPLAATGLLSPVFAALAMVASSLTVVAVSRGAGAVERAPTAGPAHGDEPDPVGPPAVAALER